MQFLWLLPLKKEKGGKGKRENTGRDLFLCLALSVSLQQSAFCSFFLSFFFFFSSFMACGRRNRCPIKTSFFFFRGFILRARRTKRENSVKVRWRCATGHWLRCFRVVNTCLFFFFFLVTVFCLCVPLCTYFCCVTCIFFFPPLSFVPHSLLFFFSSTPKSVAGERWARTKVA